jgi:hypothetical protein
LHDSVSIMRDRDSARFRIVHAKYASGRARGGRSRAVLVIPSLAIQIGTVLAFFVGFGMGWWWRGRHDRELAAELLARERGREVALRAWENYKGRATREAGHGQIVSGSRRGRNQCACRT